MIFLFVLDNLEQNCGANVNIAVKLAKEFRDNGHEVYALTHGENIKITSDINSCAVFDAVDIIKLQAKKQIGLFVNEKSLSSKIILLIRHPNLLFYLVDSKFFCSDYIAKQYAKYLNRNYCDKNIDFVIAVSAPYYISSAVAKSKLRHTKISVQLDPFVNNYTLKNFNKWVRRIIEKRTVKNLDYIFALPLVYDELQIYHSNKIKLLEFPGIDKNRKSFFDNNLLSNKTINLVFTGKFYTTIREPDWFLDLVGILPSEYVFHIVGGGLPEIEVKYKKKLGDRLVLHGWKTPNETARYISCADFLVNINNSIPNQLPSKLFEYFSSGKPIINICKLKNCPSLRYISMYSNSITLFESDDIYEVVGMVTEFLATHKNITLSQEEVIEKFHRNTDHEVSNSILYEIERTAVKRNSRDTS